jgi:hypothetical protein
MLLAVINHLEHKLFIENADENEIQEKYNGEEEDYIRDKYGFTDEDLFSWEYLTQRIEIIGDIRGLYQMMVNNSKFVDLR